MKEIKEIEVFSRNEQAYKDSGINGTFYWAYQYSRESENELVDFCECIWDNDIEAIVKDCKTYGIEEFTISSTFSSLTNVIAEFLNKGCTLEGMTTVNSRHKDFFTKERESIPAFKIKVN